MKVRITKKAAVENPVAPTPKFSEYKLGQLNNGVSIPIDYYIEGDLVGNIEEGKPVTVNRTNRNGVECPGLFQTSTVTLVGPNYFNTQNSSYLIEYL